MNPPDTTPSRAPDFNALARPYRWLEYLSFGPWLERTRFHFLPDITTLAPQQALVLGDGDGRFTARMMAVVPDVRVSAVDASPAMLAALAHRARAYASRLETTCADLRSWQPGDADFQLIASHFFLDCLTTQQATALAARLHRNTPPDTVWVVSEFCIPPGLFGTLIARPLVTLLYGIFRLLTGLTVNQLPDHNAALTASGWSLARRHTRLGGLLVSEWWRR